MCTDIERSLFSPRASQGQIVALRMGRLEGRHCCFGACVTYNLKALLRAHFARLPERETACSDLSVLCVSNSERYCVWRSRGYFNCLTTGGFNSMVSFYRYLFRRLRTTVSRVHLRTDWGCAAWVGVLCTLTCQRVLAYTVLSPVSGLYLL